MARILQALVNIGADVANEDESRIAFADTNMFDGDAIAVSAIHLIART